jgi:hypothetical protein
MGVGMNNRAWFYVFNQTGALNMQYLFRILLGITSTQQTIPEKYPDNSYLSRMI